MSKSDTVKAEGGGYQPLKSYVKYREGGGLEETKNDRIKLKS